MTLNDLELCNSLYFAFFHRRPIISQWLKITYNVCKILSPSSSLLLLAKTIMHPAARSLCNSWASCCKLHWHTQAGSKSWPSAQSLSVCFRICNFVVFHMLHTSRSLKFVCSFLRKLLHILCLLGDLESCDLNIWSFDLKNVFHLLLGYLATLCFLELFVLVLGQTRVTDGWVRHGMRPPIWCCHSAIKMHVTP